MEKRKKTDLCQMDQGYVLLLPEGVSDYFEVVKVDISSTGTILHLDELNLIPEEYQGQRFQSKGFIDSSDIEDFPLRGKPVILRVRRRKWLIVDTGKIIIRNWDLVAKGTLMTQEFASFLKALYRYQSLKL